MNKDFAFIPQATDIDVSERRWVMAIPHSLVYKQR